jgi:phosphatidylserine decarboxylase
LITKHGYDVVSVVGVLICVSGSLVWYFVDWKGVRLGIVGLLFLCFLLTLAFFRDPQRTVPIGDRLVIAPADGKIVQITEVQEPAYLQGNGIQVSIFMSPLNVHVNRFPVSGRVGYFKHYPGKYFAAYEEKASLSNEQTHIGIDHGGTRVLLKQIAGMIARRIVAEVSVGDHAVAGARFGMIKFGSRVDVILPNGTDLKVKLGDKTLAGSTVLAVLS